MKQNDVTKRFLYRLFSFCDKNVSKNKCILREPKSSFCAFHFIFTFVALFYKIAVKNITTDCLDTTAISKWIFELTTLC